MTAILEMRGISKSFPGVKALRNVNLAVQVGEIHAICGENGAGKSTLMKVLSGVYPHGSYEGEIFYQGAERQFATISDSEHLGIIIIHQELALVPLLSIAENIFLGNEPARFGVIDWNAAFSRTRELLAKVGLNEPPTTLITNLGVGKQQLVEIAKALAKKVQLLILVDPGDVLGIAGLMGSGGTELAMSIFGRAYGRNIAGKAFMEGREIDLSSIQRAIASGIAYVTEDRKSLGLILNDDIKNNVTLAN